MARWDKFAPAFTRRAFFIVGALTLPASAAVPLSAPPELAQVGLPDAAEIARILVQFRQTGIAGDYFLEFDLRTLPRRGDEQSFQGKMWGSRNVEGAITRVVLAEGADREQRLLVQNGGAAAVWRREGQQPVALDAAALFSPVVPGVNLTAFDLQMPFLYWPGVTLEKNHPHARPSGACLRLSPAGGVCGEKSPGRGGAGVSGYPI